ncbi:AGE family epimerase/isomerase [Salegentibacter sp. F188]|uniref:Cellobiose 2-epimerase n=1 Tax=Autumnicola patrickiae TaxID=3075591 RepID=A0ABU3DZ46_9FLAO|nr:AGE family epimerase/isomerase [Salegentibacter sp. F188]MDT0688989.1 AGE family epimerase/isomerase [Salegentibacter sp. F188]
MQLNSHKDFRNELSAELDNILGYWKRFSPDDEHGGFVGCRDHYNKLILKANKGIILNTRLLWTFSAIGNFRQDKSTVELATRAYKYLKDYFQDKKNGGVFWELDYTGKPVNTRKQIYAQAFAVYALSEYYKLTKEEEVKNWAVSLFELIEEHGRDRKNNGYLEAFQQDWSPIEDMRLSEKEDNSAKTMNTHLHILEAYTTLYQITKEEKVREALHNLSILFLEKFYAEEIQHFHLFFDVKWNRTNNIVSYGHDIEAVWLIIEAVRTLNDTDLLKKANRVAVDVAETFLKEGYVKGAGVLNEKNLDTGNLDTDRHWWPQVEAMVGLDFAFRITNENEFQEAISDIWEYTKSQIIDRENGEWHFRLNKNNEPYTKEDKLSMWKAPYHNSRACMMLLK